MKSWSLLLGLLVCVAAVQVAAEDKPSAETMADLARALRMRIEAHQVVLTENERFIQTAMASKERLRDLMDKQKQVLKSAQRRNEQVRQNMQQDEDWAKAAEIAAAPPGTYSSAELQKALEQLAANGLESGPFSTQPVGPVEEAPHMKLA